MGFVFFFNLAALGLSCDTQDLPCRIFRAGYFVAVDGLQSMWAWFLQLTGLVASWHVGF